MATREYSTQTPPKFSVVAIWRATNFGCSHRWCDVSHFILLGPACKTQKTYFAKSANSWGRNTTVRLYNGITGDRNDAAIVTEAEYAERYEQARVKAEQEKMWNILTSA